MRSHHIGFFIILGGVWGSHLVSVNFAHVSHCVNFLNIHAVDLFNILLNFWFRESLVDFENQNVVIDFYPGPLQQNLMVDEAIVGMFFGEITIFRSLSRVQFTSRP